jgi:hypothetical protein
VQLEIIIKIHYYKLNLNLLSHHYLVQHRMKSEIRNFILIQVVNSLKKKKNDILFSFLILDEYVYDGDKSNRKHDTNALPGRHEFSIFL